MLLLFLRLFIYAISLFNFTEETFSLEIILCVQRELLNQKLDHKRQKVSDHSTQLQDLKAELNELRSAKLKIETDLQQRTRLEQTKEELGRTNETLEVEIRVSSD